MNLILVLSMLLNISFSQNYPNPELNAVWFHSSASTKEAFEAASSDGQMYSLFDGSRVAKSYSVLIPKVVELAHKAYLEQKLIYECISYNSGTSRLTSALVIAKSEQEIQKIFKEIAISANTLGELTCSNINLAVVDTEVDDAPLRDMLGYSMAAIGQYFSRFPAGLAVARLTE